MAYSCKVNKEIGKVNISGCPGQQSLLKLSGREGAPLEPEFATSCL